MMIRPPWRHIAVGLATLITLLWAINFLWTLSLSAQYGGSALNGFVRDGHYYLGQHGTYTQINQATWELIRLHELVVWLGAPLVVISFGYLLFSVGFPRVIGLRQGEIVAERVRSVRASGTRIIAKTCAGSIGRVGLGGPFIFIEVFPGGLTVRIFLNQPIAILKREMHSNFPGLGMYVITHTSPDIASPVHLYYVQGSALAGALDQLTQSLPDDTRHHSSR